MVEANVRTMSFSKSLRSKRVPLIIIGSVEDADDGVFVDLHRCREGGHEDDLVFGVDGLLKGQVKLGVAGTFDAPVVEISGHGGIGVEDEDKFAAVGKVGLGYSNVLVPGKASQFVQGLLDTTAGIALEIKVVAPRRDAHVVNVEGGRCDLVVDKVEGVETQVADVGILFDHDHEESSGYLSGKEVDESRLLNASSEL